MIPKHLILSGGAALTAAFIGAVRALEQYAQNQGKVFSAECSMFTGTSGGSVLALLLCINNTSYELEVLAEEMRQHVASNMAFDLELLFGKFGGCDSAIMGTFLRECVRRKTGRDALSFEELTKLTGRHLFVRVLNVDSGKIETLSSKSHPHVDIVVAVQASCAIPLLFAPVNIGQHCYLDVAIIENAHLESMDETSMALVTCGQNTTAHGPSKRLFDFIQQLVSSITIIHTGMQIKSMSENKRKNVVVFDVKIMGQKFPASMYPTNEDLKRIVSEGFTKMSTHLDA